MIKQNLLLSIVFILIISVSFETYSQEVTDAGSFSGTLNGKEFKNMIRFGESDKIVSLATGDETFTLTVNFKDITSISEIKTGTVNLPDKSVTVLYIDSNMGMPSIITSGKLTITENSDNILKGKLEFTASAGGVPKEMGGKEIKLSNGTFEIPKSN